MKRYGKKSLSKWKKELDKVFSEWVRRSAMDSQGLVVCYTCGREVYWKQIHCGHFASRSYLSTRFKEDNVRPQCVGCNIFGGGQLAVFANKLEAEKKGTVARLYKEAQKITKWTAKDYEEKINLYKKKLQDL